MSGIAAGQVGDGRGVGDLAPDRLDRDVDPDHAPIVRDQTPAQQTTVPVATSPVVSTPRIVAAVDLDAGHLATGERPWRRGRARRPRSRARRPPGRVPVERAERRREHAVEPRQRGQRRGLLERDEPAGHAELVLHRDERLERVDVLVAVEQEQVADAMEVDLGSRALAKRSNASRLRRPTAMLSGSENCARTPPAALLVEPEASSARSSSSTSTPASARWKAALVPITPPPTTTTSAVVGSALIAGRRSSGRSRDWRAAPRGGA